MIHDLARDGDCEVLIAEGAAIIHEHVWTIISPGIDIAIVEGHVVRNAGDASGYGYIGWGHDSSLPTGWYY